MRRALATAVLALLLAGVRVSEAQVLTGSLTGTVRDKQGLAMPGAQVRLTSPLILGGAAETTSDSKGRFSFPALSPGQYEIAVTKNGFVTSTASDIQMKTGAEANLDFVLTAAGLTDAVQVTASSDKGNPGLATHYGDKQLLQLPTLRNGMFGFITLGPFISQTSRSTSFVSALGGGVDQNSYYADGTNITAASNSVARTEPGIDFAQDVRVQLMPSAEYGNVQGAVIEMIMRQGTDRYLWDGSIYSQPSGLTSQPIVRPINFTSTHESGYERHRYANATTTLGGPIVRNHALFFAGYEYLHDEDSQPGADPAFPKRYLQHKAFGKVTWLIAPGWQLMQSAHFEAWDNRELPTASKLPEATQRLQATVPAITFGNLTHVSGANRVWEMSAGRYEWSQDITRSMGDPAVPGRINLVTGVQSGAPMQIGALNQVRWTARASVSQYQTGLLRTDHQWKVGGQFDRGQHRSLLVVPTGRRYIDNPPLPVRGVEQGPSNAAGRFNTASAFFTDEFHVGPRISVAAGLRFDYSRAISPDIAELDAAGNETGRMIAGQGFLYSWQVFSPRVSVAAQLTADGRTIARLSYGKFRQGIMTGELSPDHPGAAEMRTGVVNPVTGELVNPSITNPTSNIEIDHDTRAPTTDTYSFVFEREIAKPLTASMAYVHKDGTNFIGWNDTGGTYSQGSRTTDYGVTVPVYVLTSAASSRVFNLTNQRDIPNQPDYSLTYDGFTVMVEKRLSRGWYASASYTRSEARGLQPSGGTTAAGAQVATTGAPPVSFSPPVTFGRDPNALTNAGGRLPNDRPNLFRLTGSLDVPRTGIIVAAAAQYSSGKPWATTTDINLSMAQGPTRILLEERGTQRLSAQTVLDVRMSRPFSLGTVGHADLRFDILNAFNDTAEESIVSDRFDATTAYKVPNVFLDPRRVMISVRVSVGK